MKQMKAIFKKYQAEKVRVQRAASAIVDAHQAVIHAQHALVQAYQNILQAQHDLVLVQGANARANAETDDEWLIAHEYENEEWEDGE